MSRSLLIAIVALASYALLSSVLSFVVAAIWRTRLIDHAAAASARARRVVALRALPAAGGLLLTLVVVLPAFVIFEPAGSRELAGPMLLALASITAALVVASLVIAVRTAMASARVERAWLREATVLDIDPPAGVPAFAVDIQLPVVALVGVFAPKLVAARTVIDACSHDELANIVAHERGHLSSRDNLKRWLLACAPDVLRWTPVHGEMLAFWCDAAEDAADDAATGGEERARLDLAALLIKIASLGAQPATTLAAVSPFIQADGLERRVRRLVANDPGAARSRWQVLTLPAVAATLLGIIGSAVNDPAALREIYEVVESVVAFAR